MRETEVRAELEKLNWTVLHWVGSLPGVKCSTVNSNGYTMVISHQELPDFDFTFSMKSLAGMRTADAILTMWANRGPTVMTEEGKSLLDLDLEAANIHEDIF